MSARSTDPMLDARRAREARLFIDMLQFSRLALLFGDGGSGKTALLCDWIIPALRSEAAPGESRHVVYFDAWNDAPLAALDAQIAAALPAEIVRGTDTPRLRFGPWTDRLAAWTAQPGPSLVLVFDHFERYLATSPSEGVDTFARQWIAALTAPNLRVQFLVALRTAAERLLMQRFGGRIAALGDNRVVLPPPPRRRGFAGARAASVTGAQAHVVPPTVAEQPGTAPAAASADDTASNVPASGAGAADVAEPNVAAAKRVTPGGQSRDRTTPNDAMPDVAMPNVIAPNGAAPNIPASNGAAPSVATANTTAPNVAASKSAASNANAPGIGSSDAAATNVCAARVTAPGDIAANVEPRQGAPSVLPTPQAKESTAAASAIPAMTVAAPIAVHGSDRLAPVAEAEPDADAPEVRSTAPGARPVPEQIDLADATPRVFRGSRQAFDSSPRQVAPQDGPHPPRTKRPAGHARRQAAASASPAASPGAQRAEPPLESRAGASAEVPSATWRRAALPIDDTLDDDLFGPEPTEPPQPASRARKARNRAARWGAMLVATTAAVLLSAVFLVPRDDFRIPLRARIASSSPGTTTPATDLQRAAPAPAPASPAAPPPLPSAAPVAPLPQASPPTTRPTQPADPRAVTPVDSRRPPIPPVVTPVDSRRPPLPPAADSPARSPYPAEAMPRARVVPVQTDAATIMARDLGSALASAGGGTPTIRAGIGATAGAARAASDLFIARYDVLDAMRAVDSADRRNIDSLRLLVPLQVEPIYFVVRSQEQMAFVHEIAGRRVNLGPGGTDAALGAAHLYLRLFDTPIAPQRASYMPDAEALTALVRVRSVDVVILVGRGGYGALVAQQRATPGAFKLLVFDAGSAAGKRALRSYLSLGLPPVPANPWLDRSLPSLGVMSFLVGRGDDERSGEIVRALCQQRSRLRSHGHPYWLSVGFTPVNAPGWRYAAGAERELRSCSARWSATSEPLDAAAPPMLSQTEAQAGEPR